MDDDRENTISEIEALESIFIHELQVSRDSSGWPQEVSIHLAPSTGDNSEEQYVKFTLVVTLPPRYPSEIPKIQIRNPRGLSEDYLDKILKELNNIAEINRGLPVIYRLIEAGKEHLTQSNSPSGTCSICLYEFCQGDQFTRTQCYHYFHNYCLAQHVTHGLARWMEEPANAGKASQILCPVCRLAISYSHLKGKKFPPPQESLADTDYVISKDMAELQEHMKALYSKQQQKGGIIDSEAERNRFLLSISRASTPIVVDGGHQADVVDGQQQSSSTRPPPRIYYRRQDDLHQDPPRRYPRHHRQGQPRANFNFQNCSEERNGSRQGERVPHHRKTGHRREDRNSHEAANGQDQARIDNNNSSNRTNNERLEPRPDLPPRAQNNNQLNSSSSSNHKEHPRSNHKWGKSQHHQKSTGSSNSSEGGSSRTNLNVHKSESSSSQNSGGIQVNGHASMGERESHHSTRNRRKARPLEVPLQNMPHPNSAGSPRRRKDERPTMQNGLDSQENITPHTRRHHAKPNRQENRQASSDRPIKPPPGFHEKQPIKLPVPPGFKPLEC